MCQYAHERAPTVKLIPSWEEGHVHRVHTQRSGASPPTVLGTCRRYERSDRARRRRRLNAEDGETQRGTDAVAALLGRFK
jgi:hypothetical protein